MNSIRPLSLVAGAACLVVMAGCGNSSTQTGATTSPATTSPAATSPAATSSASAPMGPATIKVATTTLGKVLADDQGRVLYMFDVDKGATSSCYGKCEAAWPPALTSGAPVAGTGADAALLGTTKRTDGTMQVTYKKMPLYRYTPDAKPGDVTGQAVKNVWWVLDSAGRPMQPAKVTLATTKLGKVLTDSRGFALYMFTVDKNGTSACYGKCEAAWPPLLTTGAPKAGAGADDGKLGTTKRTDGTMQVTYNKLPLYYYTPDMAAGDLTGQGVKTVWWLVDADGKLVKTT
jgi:predicted lipoprotein with Yx(FWY)xxD motif